MDAGRWLCAEIKDPTNPAAVIRTPSLTVMDSLPIWWLQPLDYSEPAAVDFSNIRKPQMHERFAAPLIRNCRHCVFSFEFD